MLLPELERPSYAAIAPLRFFLWAFHTFAAVNRVFGFRLRRAIAGWVLVPARGARWATAGAATMVLGAAVFAVAVSASAAATTGATRRCSESRPPPG